MPKPPNFDDESAIVQTARGGGSSMLNFLCSLIGHHRSRKRLRPTAGTWQSECILCGTRMQRIGPQHWVPVAELPEKGANAF
jgi:hypothetical protein